MIHEKETLENLMKLSMADLIAILPYSGSKILRELVDKAITNKIQEIIVQGEPY